MAQNIKGLCQYCGGTDFKYYDGLLGYEAGICKHCACTYDHFGAHLPTEWSMAYVGLKAIPQAFSKPADQYSIGEQFSYLFTALNGTLQHGTSTIESIEQAMGGNTIIRLADGKHLIHPQII